MTSQDAAMPDLQLLNWEMVDLVHPLEERDTIYL